MMYRCDHCGVEMDLAPTATNLPYFHRECAEAGYNNQMWPVEDDATTPPQSKTDDDIEVVRDIWGGTNPFMDFLSFKTSTRGRDMLTYNQPTTESSK